MHVEVSLSKASNPKSGAPDEQLALFMAASAISVWMCVWMGECIFDQSVGWKSATEMQEHLLLSKPSDHKWHCLPSVA